MRLFGKDISIDSYENDDYLTNDLRIGTTLNHSYILNFDSNCFDKELVFSGDVESGNNWNDIINIR